MSHRIIWLRFKTRITKKSSSPAARAGTLTRRAASLLCPTRYRPLFKSCLQEIFAFGVELEECE